MTEKDRSGANKPRLGRLRATVAELALVWGIVGTAVGAYGVYFGLSRSTADARCPPTPPPPPPPPMSASTRSPAVDSQGEHLFHLDLGKSSAREHLLEGWGPAEQRDGRVFAAQSDSAATVQFPIETVPKGARLILVARSTHGSQLAGVLVGERRIGQFRVGPRWSRRQLILAPGVLRLGPNQLTFDLHRAQKDRSLLFEQLTIAPLADSVEVVCGTASSEGMLVSGWRGRGRDGARLIAKCTGGRSRLELFLQPSSSEYALTIIARSALQLPADTPLESRVRVNGAAVGSCSFPTSWSGCHLLVKPAALRPGSNTIDLHHQGVEGEGGGDADGERVSLLVERVGLRPVGPSIHIDSGHPDHRAFLLSGFTPDPPWGAAPRYVWSEGPRSRLQFPLAPGDGGYDLEVEGFAFRPIAPVEVSVQVNGNPSIGSVTLQEQAGVHRLAIPPGQLISGSNSLELVPARTGQPKQYSQKSQDSRELGIGLTAIRLSPAE